MSINLDKPNKWKKDIIKSVDMYNDWFMRFAPKAFRETRIKTTKDVIKALEITEYLSAISSTILKSHPEILPTLRMSTCPPIAVDRLIGLSGVSPNLVKKIEKEGILPPKMPKRDLMDDLGKIGKIIMRMADVDIFVWLEQKKEPTKNDVHRASTIIADRLCGAVANPIIRNAQEQRQLSAISSWLKSRGYKPLKETSAKDVSFDGMPKGAFSFRMNVPIKLEGGVKKINIPVDAVIMPRISKRKLPILIEAKSAGDFTNVNKRRKEEAVKMQQLKQTYGKNVSFNLFLCGYFDSGYLGYEAAEGIDWIWEHRIDDMKKLGL
ncbi:MAG: XamI family restriction endonuclease [Candidatus Scalinduaceae bacterium]